MSARSKARKQALDILYESDIRSSDALAILESRDVTEEGPDARPIRDFTRELITGVSANKRKIDELIATYAQGWDMDRLAAVDRNILRLGIFEIIWSDELADGIAIDEAITLAKDLSTDDSATFIHGLLGKISSIKDSVAR
ncbi:NusB Transcription termination factor [Candidatus Nanopelagicaceae bacterium]